MSLAALTNRRSLEPRFKIENFRIHRFGRPRWVKILPKVCDLIASGTSFLVNAVIAGFQR
jgi:hypothetical protein